MVCSRTWKSTDEIDKINTSSNGSCGLNKIKRRNTGLGARCFRLTAPACRAGIAFGWAPSCCRSELRGLRMSGSGARDGKAHSYYLELDSIYFCVTKEGFEIPKKA